MITTLFEPSILGPDAPERGRSFKDVPSPARIHDYLVGGHHNFAADREIAEGIRNALRHAHGCTTVSVALDFGPGRASLAVRDDGLGFRVPQPLSMATLSRHFGLVGRTGCLPGRPVHNGLRTRRGNSDRCSSPSTGDGLG